ncbi:MAG: TolC family protein, partial [Planctomycetaceae bacterium]|nr:TolC family protein [Planctomycetaceae bacterium]
LEIWEKQRVRKEIGTRGRQDESQARDQYFALASAADNARSQLYTAETRFRRLIGLAAGDGTILRPADSPVTAEFLPEWYHCLTEALTERVELRRQKWNIKSLELQYKAAQSLVKPRLDFIGNYQVNGFGDDLIGYTDAQAYDNFYQSLTDGNQTGWNLGVQFRWDIGFRSQLAQVRNYELRLAKARRVLQEQEEEISHELAFAFQELSRSFNSAEQNQNRVFAAQENVEVFRLQEQVGIDVPQGGESIIDQRLRSETRLAQAQIAFHESLVAYQKALTDLQYRKGTLLEYNCIYLAEGGWKPEAYADAKRNAEARAHAIANPYLHTAPPAFSGPSPFGGVFFTHPENELGPAPGLLDSPEAMPIPANDSSPVDELPDGDHSGAEDSPSRETALIEQTSAERPNPVPPPRAAVPPIFNVGAGAVQWID